ncbi:hypothetical protein DYE50_03290 [Treponema ruminis]|uniref:Uncharacterized protein n=1 Tax=Treponema ruminis TaxID=744515 RepID=A0A7W8LLK9_9SPIR|nr:hypothetical protein [Treponema ruminis]MBB5225529.1 hypothetical protein [Treponema ruminis]QSI01602.1 hypothetical protein DYE50_03290 [Treponema ruminis]
MLQFYFLSILLNLVAGLIFIYVVKGEGEASLILSDSDDPFGEGESSSNSSDFNPETDDLDLGLDGDSSSQAGDSDSSAKKAGGLGELALPFLGDKTLQLVVGILSALTGLMKLLSPIQYDIAIIGDLVPALAGLAAGAVLLLDWYQERSEVELTLPEALQGIYEGGRKYLGIFCIIAAVLHFIFPRVLFL